MGDAGPTPHLLLGPEVLWRRDGVVVWHEGLVRHDLGLHLIVMVLAVDPDDPATMALPWRTRIPIEAEIAPRGAESPLGRDGALGAGAGQICCEFQFSGEAPPGSTLRIRALPLAAEASWELR